MVGEESPDSVERDALIHFGGLPVAAGNTESATENIQPLQAQALGGQW